MPAGARSSDSGRRAILANGARLDPIVFDVAAALFLSAVALVDVISRQTSEGFRGDDALGIALLLGQTAPLALRKASPLGMLAFMSVALVAHAALGYEVVQAGTFATLVGLYGATASTDSRGSRVAAAITAASMIGFFATNRGEWGVVDMAATAATWAMGWFLAYLVKLEGRVRARTRELQTLLDMSRAVTSTLELRQLYEVALDHLRELIPYTGAAIQETDAHGTRQVATRRPPEIQGEPIVRLPAWNQTSIVTELNSGKPVIIGDVRGSEPKAIEYRETLGRDIDETPLRYFRSWMSVPLQVRERVIGNIGIVHEKPGYFGREHVELAMSVANHVAIAIENARLFDESARKARELETLLDTSRAVASMLDLQQLFEVALDRLRDLVPYSGAGIGLRFQDQRLVGVNRRPGADQSPLARRPGWLESSMMKTLRAGTPIVIDDLRGGDPFAVEYRAWLLTDIAATPMAYARSLLAVPLIVKGSSIGDVSLTHEEPGFFREEHVRLTQTVANHLGVAIENARLFEERARKARELGALLELSRSVASRLDQKELFEVAMDRLRDLVPYSGGSIALRMEDGMRVSTIRRPGENTSPVQRRPGWADSTFIRTLGAGAPILIEDMRSEEPFAVEYRSWLLSDIEDSPVAYVRSLLAVPLVVKGTAFGDVTLTHEEPGHFNQDHVELLQTFANHLAIALENARLFEESARRTANLQALLEMSEAVTSTLDLDALFEVALDKLKDLIPYTGANIGLRSGETSRQVASRRPAGISTGPVRRAPGFLRSPVMDVLSAGKPLIISDVRGDEPLAVEFRATLDEPIETSHMRYFRSLVSVPLIVKSRVIGDLSVSHSEPGFFRQEHVELAQSVANHVAIAIENARLFEETDRKAREVEALLQAGESMHRSLALSDVFEAVVEVATAGLGLHFAVLMLRDEVGAGLTVRAQRGFAELGGAAAKSLRLLPEQPAEVGTVWAVTDTLEDPEANQALSTELGMRALLQVPIVYRGTNGVLMFGYREPHEWTEQEIRLCQALAQRARLAIENAVLFEESETRAREMEALYRADEKLFSSLDLDDVLQSLADIAVDVLGADKSMVSIAEGPEGRMVPRAWRNISEAMRDFYRVREPGTGKPAFLRGDVVALGLEEVSPDIRPVLEKEGIVATLDVPIVFEGRIRGAFGLAWTGPHESNESEKASAFALAQRSAVAIQNANLYARAQQAASLEERQRLARELHDSVSQALYGIALGARTARTQLDREPAKATEPMDYVLSLAEAGLAEMRALIFELRPESLETEGLVAALDKQVAAVRARHGLSVSVDLGAEPVASLDVKEAVYRIAQEALQNIVKHAQAREVSVALADSEEALELTITDDGRGFDPGGDFPGHMGLRSMRERASRAAGDLTIESAPGHGCRISASFPKVQRGR